MTYTIFVESVIILFVSCIKSPSTVTLTQKVEAILLPFACWFDFILLKLYFKTEKYNAGISKT